jgi:hypothetical protein
MRRRAPRRAFPALLALPCAVALAACSTGLPPQPTPPQPVKGEGAVMTEDRTTGEFQHLSVGGGLQVIVTAGSPVSVTLSAQPNLLPLITTEVDAGQLVVNIASPGLSSAQPITLTATVPDLRSLTLSGGANGTLEMTADDLRVDVSGGARLEARGTVTSLALAASGGGQVKFADFVATSATVTMSGGSQAEMAVVDTLSGTASEGANLRLTRKPASLSVSTTGGAIIQGG